MNDLRRAVDSLPLVVFAPFMAVGAAVNYLLPNDAVRSVLFLLAALAFAVSLLYKMKTVRYALAGLFSGISVMMLYVSAVCVPLYDFDGCEKQVDCYITECYGSAEGIAVYNADIFIDGRKTKVSFVTSEVADVCDTITAVLKFKKQTDSYKFSQGVLLDATVKKLISVNKGAPTLNKRLSDYRQKLADELVISLGEQDGGLAAAMLLGDKSRYSEQLRLYSGICGVSHLTAVSGMHFVLCLCVLLYFVSRVQNRFVKPLFSLMIVPVMVLFFGAGASVVRAGIMAAICSISTVIGRKPCTVNSLCVTLAAVIFVQPHSVMDSGFIMSVLGVYGAAVMAPEISRRLPTWICAKPVVKHIIDLLIASVCASFCTSPVSAALYGGISTVSALMTVMLSPFFTVAMTFMVIYGISGGMLNMLLVPIAICVRIMRWLIEFFGKIYSLWLPMSEDISWVLLGVAVCAATVAIIVKNCRLPALISGICICGAVLTGVYHENTACELLLYSNGKSGAAIVRNGRSASVMISGDGVNMGTELVSCMRTAGITDVSAIIAPQLTYNGAVSLQQVVDGYDVPVVYTNEDAEKILSCQTLMTEPVDHISIGEYTLQCAHVSDDASADIVLYHGYKLSAPDNDAGIALYCSSRQTMLPDNGYNIYHDNFIPHLQLKIIDHV